MSSSAAEGWNRSDFFVLSAADKVCRTATGKVVSQAQPSAQLHHIISWSPPNHWGGMFISLISAGASCHKAEAYTLPVCFPEWSPLSWCCFYSLNDTSISFLLSPLKSHGDLLLIFKLGISRLTLALGINWQVSCSFLWYTHLGK